MSTTGNFMDISKLRIFTTIARIGNFTRAAELLYLTQPTVSQQLATLEAHIGAPLIERLPRRLKLTPAGEALLPYAEQILALADAGAEAARAAAGQACQAGGDIVYARPAGGDCGARRPVGRAWVGCARRTGRAGGADARAWLGIACLGRAAARRGDAGRR